MVFVELVQWAATVGLVCMHSSDCRPRVLTWSGYRGTWSLSRARLLNGIGLVLIESWMLLMLSMRRPTPVLILNIIPLLAPI
jgi:hypothetical protein